MDQQESHNTSLFSQCHCKDPGYCPIFCKRMGENPPDWEWCKKSSPNDRKSYFDLLAKAPPSNNVDTFNIINQAKTKEEAFLYYLTLKNNEYMCNIAQQNQIKRNEKIVELIEKPNHESDFTNIEIAFLGHSNFQFDNIDEQSYIRKINLNDLNLEKHNGNEWAETRAFLSENLFSKDVDFIGFISASWNDKYESFSKIDNFHNWTSAKILLNSKPEDNIVLCADIFCPCWWTTNKYHSSNILSSFFGNESHSIGITLLKLVKLDNFNHIKVPFANQIIAHKNTIQKYTDYLKEKNILDKVDWFVKKYALKHIDNSNEIKALYQNNRIQAYLMEMISCFWFANQDFIYIPNTHRKKNWYEESNVKRRIELFEATKGITPMKQYKKNRYQEYLKQAIFSEKSNNLDFACVLYKECLKMNPGDKYLQQKILGFEKIKDCSQCVCPKPEYCLRYKSDMSNGLIDHNWCKNASTQEREIFLSYKNSLQKHTSLPDGGCIFANAHNIKHKEITLNTKSKGRVKVSRLKIFCVGHSQKQFETIKYKPYLETVNLNHLNVGKYSGNEWAEARGFLAYEDLVSDDMDFVGFVTASWNSKYTEPIHDFHKWDNVKILLNSKPEDKIFLCADLLCSCEWIKQQNILGTIYKNNPKQIVKSFLKLIGLKSNYHKYVPCSNQMISHKENIKEYVDFLISNEILDKISWYVEKLGNDNFVDSFTKYSYNQNRVKAYFTELVSFFWFANQDYTYLPTVKRLTDWYTAEKIEKREKEWK